MRWADRGMDSTVDTLEGGMFAPLSDHPRRFLGPLGLDSGRTITPFRKNIYWKEKDNPNQSSWKKIWFGLSLSVLRRQGGEFEPTVFVIRVKHNDKIQEPCQLHYCFVSPIFHYLKLRGVNNCIIKIRRRVAAYDMIMCEG